MTTKEIIRVGGMSCVRCSTAVEHALKSVNGVVSAEVSYASGRAAVEYDPSLTDRKKLEKAIKSAGYSVVLDRDAYRKREFKTLKTLFIISAVFAVPFLVMMVLMFVLPNSPVTHFLHHNGLLQLILTLPVQFGVGLRFYKGAFHSLVNKSPSMDLLIVSGTTAAFGYSLYNLLAGKNEFYFESCVIIITLILFGKMLESRAKNRASSAISKLMDLTPKTAMVLRGGKFVEIPAEKIQKNDIFLVRPGKSLPADGIVTKGSTSIDESMLTGESMPVKKAEGDKVFGGTVNSTGVIEVRAVGIGEETVLSSIIKMVEDAQSSKAHIQNVADKVSSYFVPAVMLIALLTFGISLTFSVGLSGAVSRAVAVLVIACPCSLGLATPAALTVGIGRAATMGILIKNADALENTCRIKTVIFDKTGTVTEGKPSVTDIFSPEMPKDRLLCLAAAVEKNSEHPLAQAVVKSAKGDTPPAENFESVTSVGVKAEINGRTVKVGKPDFGNTVKDIPSEITDYIAEHEAMGQTVLCVSIDDRAVGALSVADKLSAGVKEAVKELKFQSIIPIMATGDNTRTAQSTAAAAGIDDVRAELMPQDKLNIVASAQKNGPCGFVGDGINDAPSLAAADVGFAISSGTDIAMEAGDIVLTGGSITLLPNAVKLSKATMRKIKQNLFWAFFYNSASIPLAAFGLLSPILAGAAMAFSSVSVVTNSLLLKRTRLK